MPNEGDLSMPRNSVRWLRFGPYFGMFPIEFAIDVVNKYSQHGDVVFDPFAGRGTSVAVAVALGRKGVGIEINPVGWVYGQVKLSPSEKQDVLDRLYTLNTAMVDFADEAENLPEFYHWCFCKSVRQFLLASRSMLDWRNNHIDTTLMGFILLYLQGKQNQALSNQMRQQKSMSPGYSIRWWKERNFVAPKIDPMEFLSQKIFWRYAWGTLKGDMISNLLLGDARLVVPGLIPDHSRNYALLLTSPPYFNLTSYYYDHWLRYWLLGGPELPTRIGEAWRQESRQDNLDRYRKLLEQVFQASAHLMREDAIVYVRTGSRTFTFDATKNALETAFPNKELSIKDAPFMKKTQTALFGDHGRKPGEVDFILR